MRCRPGGNEARPAKAPGRGAGMGRAANSMDAVRRDPTNTAKPPVAGRDGVAYESGPDGGRLARGQTMRGSDARLRRGEEPERLDRFFVRSQGENVEGRGVDSLGEEGDGAEAFGLVVAGMGQVVVAGTGGGAGFPVEGAVKRGEVNERRDRENQDRQQARRDGAHGRGDPAGLRHEAGVGSKAMARGRQDAVWRRGVFVRLADAVWFQSAVGVSGARRSGGR